MSKVLVAISGGVDSSLSAALLLEQGYEVTGAYMKNWINDEGLPGDCPWQKDIKDARKVCDHLNIEFRIINMMRDYKDHVIDYFLNAYNEGITPNPDVMCNKDIKFGVFKSYAEKQNFNFIATGHYSKIKKQIDNSLDIYCGDPNKDQSYFLALLKQKQIQKVKFPIGNLSKDEVRKKAFEMKLPVASKKDSQGICFIGNIKMSDFLSYYIKDDPGNIVSIDGDKLGTHRGLHFYTLGQRKRLGIASNVYKRAYVVVDKKRETNDLVVAIEEEGLEDNSKLYSHKCIVGNISVINKDLSNYLKIEAKPRYRSESVPIDIKFLDNNDLEVKFHEPQRAITPGQICAFYSGEKLLGGGIFKIILE